MTDVVDKATRSRMMSGIRGKDTKPELQIRKALHARGFRYLLHDRRLPGKPDIVLPKYNAVIFIHGCFWHGHDCHLFKMPKSRRAFWNRKINGNRQRDEETYSRLREQGWYILTVWECALKGRGRYPADTVIDKIVDWIKYSPRSRSIRGKTI